MMIRSNRKFARLGAPFPVTAYWPRIECSAHNSRVPLMHLSRALNVSVDRVQSAYKPILTALGMTMPTNQVAPDGYVYVADLRALFLALKLGWTAEEVDRAVAYFDLDNLSPVNGGLQGRRSRYTPSVKKRTHTAAVLDLVDEDDHDDDDDDDNNEQDERIVKYKRASLPEEPVAAGAESPMSPAASAIWTDNSLQVEADAAPKSWQEAFQIEMRNLQGPRAIFAYRTTKAYKKAVDEALRQDILKDDLDAIRAEIKSNLEERLYPDIKKRVTQEMRDMYASNPQWELRLQQQEARRALAVSPPPRKEGGWQLNLE